MKQLLFPFCFTILTLVGCDRTAGQKESEIYAIRSMGTLSTSEYTVGKVIKMNDKGEWYTFGDRKILISCKAKIKAGVNLNELEDKDIVVNGKKIEIQLPPPHIISFEMDPQDIHTEMVEINGFRAAFSQVEKNKILQKGEASIRKDMQKLGVLDDAEKNATVFIKDFYKELGFEEVIVHGTEKEKRNQNLDR